MNNPSSIFSEKEEKFIQYWEQNREKEKKWTRQLLYGLPLGLVFAIPIILNYSSSWYTRAKMVGNSQFNPNVLIIAVLVIVVFAAMFYRKHRWDQLELTYQELMARKKKMEDQQSSTSD
jgi:membrane protein YdbS with pleckstrin-like domain